MSKLNSEQGSESNGEVSNNIAELDKFMVGATDRLTHWFETHVGVTPYALMIISLLLACAMFVLKRMMFGDTMETLDSTLDLIFLFSVMINALRAFPESMATAPDFDPKFRTRKHNPQKESKFAFVTRIVCTACVVGSLLSLYRDMSTRAIVHLLLMQFGWMAVHFSACDLYVPTKTR
jgi:hypothetical protein